MGIVRGRVRSAPRVLIYGPPKVGKTTAATETEDPVFISGEAGDGQFNVARYEFDSKTKRYWPISWDEVLKAVKDIATNGGGKTLVFDGFGAIEKLAAEHVCKASGWKNLAAPGYGKGEAALLAEIQSFLRHVEDAWAKGIAIVFVCHSKIGKVKTPGSADEYQRLEPALTNVNNGDVSGLLVGWCDAVLLAETEVEIAKVDKKIIGRGTGRHVFRTQKTAAIIAGCRYGNVPAVMDLDMREFLKLVDEGQDPERMKAKLVKLASGLDEETKKRVDAWLATPAAKDALALCRAAARLQEQIEEQAA